MQNSVELTRRRLRRSLARDLQVYEQYVASGDVLVEYLQATKEALLGVVADAFDDKIASLKVAHRERGKVVSGPGR